ncbi:MAG: amino acid permease [Chloroflexia bacterium]
MSEKVFARKASGLVRGLSLLDAFGVGFMNQGLTPSMWVMISLGLGVYAGGNLILATIISAVMCGIGFSLVWGILGGSMPRSGGEYIYNSRILHPLVGIAESFGNAFVWVMWIFVLAPWTVDPGMVMMFQFLGRPDIAEFLTQPWVLFAFSTLVSLIGMLFLIFGIKVFATAQKVVMFLGILGCAVILLVFTFTSAGGFREAWDRMAASAEPAEADLSTMAEDAGVDMADAEAVAYYLQAQLLGRTPVEDIVAPGGIVIVRAGNEITGDDIAALAALHNEEGIPVTVRVKPLTYDAFLRAVSLVMDQAEGRPLPNTWNWVDTLGVMVAGSWLFAYSYCITFIAGEVKRPDKSIILGNLFAILVPAFFMLWLAIVLYNTVGFQFLSATAYVDNTWGNAFLGLPFSWSPQFVGLAAVVTQHPVLIVLMAGSFVLFSLWWVALSYMAFPRILFAWGMDRVGPRWFTDIHPRWGTPVWTHLLCFGLGEIGILLYAFWQNPMTGLSVTGMEIVSVFGVTAIAAALFPFIRKVRNIWEASPYRKWNILNIPVVTIGAVVNLAYLAILFVFFFLMPYFGGAGLEELTLGSGALYLVVWVAGILWYYFWKWWNRRQAGIDIGLAYGELPPE